MVAMARLANLGGGSSMLGLIRLMISLAFAWRLFGRMGVSARPPSPPALRPNMLEIACVRTPLARGSMVRRRGMTLACEGRFWADVKAPFLLARPTDCS